MPADAIRTGTDVRSRWWSNQYRSIVAEILAHGEEVPAGSSLSVGSLRATREVLNHSFALASPTDRLPAGTRFNLAAALGRFVWMMSGSDRLDEIAFYDPRAASFSDDGLSVPGSCDGARLLNPRPGFNQIERLIGLLSSDAGTRRAVATIYQYDDAGRTSRDVPCHIAVAYNVRAGGLHASTIMRSCNAARVLPYDLFLFSLLAEVVAASVGSRLDSYYQYTVSMHVYTDDVDHATRLVSEPAADSEPAMPEMPRTDVPGALRRLIAAEKDIRARVPFLSATDIRAHIDRLSEHLGPYWGSFALVLVLHAARSGRLAPAELDELTEHVRTGVFAAFAAFI